MAMGAINIEATVQKGLCLRKNLMSRSTLYRKSGLLGYFSREMYLVS